MNKKHSFLIGNVLGCLLYTGVWFLLRSGQAATFIILTHTLVLLTLLLFALFTKRFQTAKACLVTIFLVWVFAVIVALIDWRS